LRANILFLLVIEVLFTRIDNLKNQLPLHFCNSTYKTRQTTIL